MQTFSFHQCHDEINDKTSLNVNADKMNENLLNHLNRLHSPHDIQKISFEHNCTHNHG